jgi:hypothetical protein
MIFEKFIPYLKDPLVLIGFFLFITFLFLRTLVTKGIIPTLKQNQGFNILRLILMYGFILGLAIIGLGFGLKYKEMGREEQKKVVSLLDNELDNNIKVISELKKNTETFLSQQIEVSKALRTESIKILPVMFPQSNLDLDKDVNTNELARQAFLELISKKLANNKTEIKKLEAFSKAIKKTISSVKQTNINLRDQDRSRYFIETKIWNANISTYKKINIIDIGLYQKAITQENNIRNDYDIIAKSVIDYLDNVADYLKDDNELTWEKLGTLLSVERHSYQLIIDYSKNLVNTLTDLKDIQTTIKNEVSKY